MYGDASVRVENGALHASLGAAFDGTLEHWHYDTFRAAWRDPMLIQLAQTLSPVGMQTDSTGETFAWLEIDTDGESPYRD